MNIPDKILVNLKIRKMNRFNNNINKNINVKYKISDY